MPRLFSWEEEERQTAAEHQRERGADNRPRPRDQLADKTGMEENEEPGLVIYPITARSEIEEQLLNLGMEMGNRQGKNAEQSGHFIVLTPGSIRIKRRGITQSKKPETAKDRQAIKAWSKKSRANMVSRFSSLDLSPLEVANKNALAVMITLTYPNDWESLVPTAAHAKNHLFQFRKRFERRFGRPFYAMWKAEFQRRGAVHFHLFTASPVPIGEFREWVAEAWTEIVDSRSEEERERHRKAGTAVDVASGATIGDARLVAVYFSKHSSANFGVKEYQNTPPQMWIDSGSVGRFWGYWKFKPVEVEALLTEREALAMARILRGWFRSKGFTRIERVARVDRQGTLTFRKMRRRSKRMSQGFGFITLEDTVGISQDLSRFLQLMRDSPQDATASSSPEMSNPADSLER